MRHLLDQSEVAQLLGTSERHVRGLIQRRDLPVVKVGHLVRVDPDDLAAWIDANRRPAVAGDAA